MKTYFVLIFTTILIIISHSCNDKKNQNDLRTTNDFLRSNNIPKKDSSQEFTHSKYCFEISHDKINDLSSYYLVIDIDRQIAFSGNFQRRVECEFNKKTKLNTFVVLLFDKKNDILFSWENKDVYDFLGCDSADYKVILFSERNINHSEGEEMEVNSFTK